MGSTGQLCLYLYICLYIYILSKSLLYAMIYMNIALSFELLVPVIAFIAAIKGFKLARKHEYQSSVRLLSYGLVLIAISYLIPFSSVLAIKMGLNNYESLGIIGDVAYLFSILIIVIGYLLITVAIFKFREK